MHYALKKIPINHVAKEINIFIREKYFFVFPSKHFLNIIVSICCQIKLKKYFQVSIW